MQHYQTILCPNCQSNDIVKNGKSIKQKQRYLCKNCRRQFVIEYEYNDFKKETKNFIVPMTLNGSGIRDISRVLQISSNTVLSTIKQANKKLLKEQKHKKYSYSKLQIDEMWTYVGNKKNQQWLWYSFSPIQKKETAYLFGKRTDDTCSKLFEQISIVKTHFYTDNWSSYSKIIPIEKHTISKKFTQNIERNNLNFRTHLKRFQRKSICFSKSQEILEAVTNLYIHYKHHTF